MADKHRTPLKVTSSGTGIDITLPAKATDPVATVLVLSTK